MSNHTPGPWIFDQGEHAHFVYVDDFKTNPYTIIAHVSAKLPLSIQNLKLIAAAPDMLEALQAAIALSDKHYKEELEKYETLERTPECKAVYNLVQAAINKATI